MNGENKIYSKNGNLYVIYNYIDNKRQGKYKIYFL